MKNTLIIMLSVAAGLLVTAGAPAQEVYNSDPASSRLERARDDAADAKRRETDLQNQIAQQERTNATNREQLRKVDADPAGLMKDLVNASDEAAALRKKVGDQRTRRDAAEDRYNEARAKALDQYEETQPMIAAKKAVADAGAELDRLSQPIMDQLSQDDGYQEAQALVDAAAQAGEALQGFENVDPKAQADADAAFDLATDNVRGLENAAMDADPKAAEARKSFKIAQDQLDGLRIENEKKIVNNPAVDAARFALDLEQKLLDDSAAELTTAEKRLSALRQTTQPGAGAPTELANQLKDGEARLRDLNDKLDQAKVATDDAEQRLRFAEGGVVPGSTQASGPTVAPPPSIDYGQPSYEPYTDYGYYDDTYAYGGYPYYGYGYTYRSYPYRYGYPYYSYGYPYYRPYYYDPFFYPYYSYGFIGAGFYFGYHHGYHYYDHHDHHDYDHGHYAYYHHDRSDAWRTHYDYYRRRDDWHGGDHVVTSHDGRSGFGSSRYNYARFNSAEVSRDRSARSSVERARSETAAAERDYRYRSGVNTYNYPGSTAWRARDQESSAMRARQYEMSERDRRAAVESSRSRSSELRGADSAARRARAEEAASADFTRPRSEWRPRTSADETRGTRANPDYSRSRSSDVGSSRSRSSDVESSRSRSSDTGSSRSRSSDVGRSSRSEAPPAREAAPSRGRSESAPPSRGSSFRGSDSGSSSARSRGSFSPPPDFGSSRGSSRGGGVAPSRSDGGSFRGGSSGSPSRGGGGSSAGSSRGGGGSSGGGGGASRGGGGGGSGGRGR